MNGWNRWIEGSIDGCVGVCMCIFHNVKDYRHQDTNLHYARKEDNDERSVVYYPVKSRGAR